MYPATEVYHLNQIELVIVDINGELKGENIILGFKLKVAVLFEDYANLTVLTMQERYWQ